MAKRMISEQTEEILDKETGELITIARSRTTFVKTTPDKYYMTFIDAVGPYLGLAKLLDRKILEILCVRAEWNTGVINLSVKERKELIELLGTSPSSFSRSLKNLKELQLIDGEEGRFTINPLVFWKGDLDTRKQLLRDGISFTFTMKEELPQPNGKDIQEV